MWKNPSERFHSTCSHFWCYPRWLFLDKKPLGLIASGYSNCETAVAEEISIEGSAQT